MHPPSSCSSRWRASPWPPMACSRTCSACRRGHLPPRRTGHSPRLRQCRIQAHPWLRTLSVAELIGSPIRLRAASCSIRARSARIPHRSAAQRACPTTSVPSQRSTNRTSATLHRCRAHSAFRTCNACWSWSTLLLHPSCHPLLSCLLLRRGKSHFSRRQLLPFLPRHHPSPHPCPRHRPTHRLELLPHHRRCRPPVRRLQHHRHRRPLLAHRCHPRRRLRRRLHHRVSHLQSGRPRPLLHHRHRLTRKCLSVAPCTRVLARRRSTLSGRWVACPT